MRIEGERALIATASAIVPPVQTVLTDLHGRYASLDDGAVATYIRELATADPGHFGIAAVSLAGYV